MSTALLESAALELGPLVDDVVFVGAATVPLWITDPAAPAARMTKDVDVVIEVTSQAQYHRFGERLRDRGFQEDDRGIVICRWLHAVSGLVLDAMPVDESVLGFGNAWFADCVASSVPHALPSGALIHAAPPALLLATKVEAFADRGNLDFYASPDFDDVVALVDGREELVAEVHSASQPVSRYIAEQVRTWLTQPGFESGVRGQTEYSSALAGRADRVVLPRLRAIAGLDAVDV